MEYSQRKALQRSRIYLQNHLPVTLVSDHLFQKEVLTTLDHQRISAEKTDVEKSGQLLNILESKGPNTYDIFLDVLESTESGFIANEIKKERINCYSSREKETWEESLGDIQQILQEKFEKQTDSVVSFEEVSDVITGWFRRRGDLWKINDIKKENLKDIVENVFPYVSIETISPRRGTTTFHFKGIWCRKESSISLPTSTEISDEDSEEEAEKNYNTIFTDMDQIELFNWLQTTLENIGIDINVADKMHDEEIDGQVFENMDVNEFKKFTGKYGPAKKLQMARDKFILENKTRSSKAKAKPNIAKQCVRHFDEEANIADKYCKGNKINLELRVLNLLRPVRLGFMPKYQTSKEILKEIASAVVKFGSACMNERTNGTLYVGVVGEDNEKEFLGEIIGVDISQEVTKEFIDQNIVNEIKKSFYKDQISFALDCIRPAQLVDVIIPDARSTKREVIEIDVVPRHRSTKTMAFFLRNDVNPDPPGDLYRICDGKVRSLDLREKEKYMQEKLFLSEHRDEAEKRLIRPRTDSNLHKKITDFLCCGGDYVEPSIFPMLVLGPLEEEMNETYLEENFSNLRNVPWRAVIDFGKSCESRFLGLMERQDTRLFLRKTINDFNEKEVNEKLLHETFERIRESLLPSWIYADQDRYGLPLSNATTWKRQCKHSFNKILDFYEKELSDVRIRVVVFLLSKSDILVEASEELFLRFETNCLVLSETESIIQPFISQIRSRNCMDQTIAKTCFIEELPWKVINDVLRSISGDVTKGETLIVQSGGSTCILPEKMNLDLCDIDIVAANECEHIHTNMAEDGIEKEKQEAAEKFYKGEEAQWVNFYFEDQVMKRAKHSEIMYMVNSALKENSFPDRLIQRVTIYHQPGAGGTTVAKQILWEFRKEYRCCSVKKITTQTCDQICRLRAFHEQKEPKPILVLLDNLDDDKVSILFENLAEEAKTLAVGTNLFCVLLLCCRRPVLPYEKDTRYVMLNQQLTAKEIGWMKETHKELVLKHNKNKGCNPKYLISFNIMKENFNQESIDRTVKEFLQDEHLKPNDMMLIKYVAFLNAFDLKKRAIPTSCFDKLFGGHRSVGTKSSWEQRLCQSTRVLLIYTSIQGMGGKFQGLRVVNSRLSRPILNAILEVEKEKHHRQSSIGEVAMEVLDSQLYSVHTFCNKKLLSILCTIVKKRKWNEADDQLDFFSPLIKELLSLKDTDTAVRVSEVSFEITDDPGIAQQVARLHIELENWKDAIQFAQESTKLSPSNSSFWHTTGQIYRKQMQALLSHFKENVPVQEIEKCITLANSAIEKYQHVQTLGENENTMLQNLAGHEGEIRVTFELLEAIERMECFTSRAQLRSFLTGEYPNFSSGLRYESVIFLRQSGKRVYEVIEKLQHCLLQAGMKQKPFYSQVELASLNTGKQADIYREKFSHYFGIGGNGQSYEHSKQLSNEQRRMIAMSYNATSLLRIMQMRSREREKIKEVLQLMQKNIQSNVESYDVRDWRIAISAILALHNIGQDRDNRNWKYLVGYSRSLYDMLQNEDKQIPLVFEAHLFLTMIHFPLPSRCVDKDTLVAPYRVVDAIESWKKEVERLPYKRKQLDKSLFYLTRRQGLDSLMIAEDLQGAGKYNLECDHDAPSILHVMTGRLTKNGEEILFSFDGIKNLQVHLLVENPVKQSGRWNRTVNFFLGFGLYGPRACVLLENASTYQGDPGATQCTTQGVATFPPSYGPSAAGHIQITRPDISRGSAASTWSPTQPAHFHTMVRVIPTSPVIPGQPYGNIPYINTPQAMLGFNQQPSQHRQTRGGSGQYPSGSYPRK